jgi:putative tricarboxylic transport membrane protein
MLLGLIILTFLAGGSMPKALMMAAFGLFLGLIGMDIMTATPRFTFNLYFLTDGVGLVPVVMGLFGISEVLLNVEGRIKQDVFETKIKGLLPNFQDWKDSFWPIVRGSVLGFFLGILPGGGAVISSFVSYAMEKRISKHPEKFGTGVIEGVAAPESANNAATGGAFIPLLTLGIPANAVMAMLLGALIIYGMQPGPMLIKQHPDLFWGTVTSMYIGNLMLLVLNLPLIGIWVKILKIPYPVLFPLILLFCLIGVFSLNNNVGEIGLMLFFGGVGYLMKKFDYESPPLVLVLALVLGPMMENALGQALIMSNGSADIFFLRPISLVIMLCALALLILPLVPWIKKKREVIGEMGEEE